MLFRSALPAKSVWELIVLAKSRPGEINYASGGSGSNLALVAELFKVKAGIQVAHVPYKGGGPASVAVMAGESQMMFAATATVIPYVEAKRLAALAITGLKRSPLLPNVPTFEESGMRDMDVGMWFGVLAPAATQKDIVARLNSEVVKMAAEPAYGKAIVKLGFEPLSSTPDKFSAFMRTELETWGKVIKAAGIKGG